MVSGTSDERDALGVVWLTGHSRVPWTWPSRPISGCSTKLFAASQSW